MKTIYSLLVIGVLFSQSIIAQKSLPPSLEPYAANWSTDMQSMLQAAGYAVPGTLKKEKNSSLIQPRSASLRLDSTITFYGYDYSETYDSTGVLRFVHTYPQPRKEVVVESYFDNENWVLLSRSTHTYDSQGRIIEVVSESFQASTGQYTPDSRLLVYPRGNSATDVDSFFVFGWGTAIQDWSRHLAVINTYNAMDQILESVTAIEFFDYPLHFIDRFTYDLSGQNTLIESFIYDGIEVLPAGKQEMTYQGGRLVSLTSFTSDDEGGYVLQEQKTYTYTSGGREEKVERYGWDDEKQTWRLVQVDSFAYDGADRLVLSEYLLVHDEGEGEQGRVTYSYQEDHYPSTETLYQWNPELLTWQSGERKIYYYTDLTTSIPEEPEVILGTFIWPNPTSGMIQVKLTGKLSVHVYSMTGQLVNRYYLTPGERFLNLSALPPGTYQVMAKSDEDYFSGKLVKL